MSVYDTYIEKINAEWEKIETNVIKKYKLKYESHSVGTITKKDKDTFQCNIQWFFARTRTRPSGTLYEGKYISIAADYNKLNCTVTLPLLFLKEATYDMVTPAAIHIAVDNWFTTSVFMFRSPTHINPKDLNKKEQLVILPDGTILYLPVINRISEFKKALDSCTDENGEVNFTPLKNFGLIAIDIKNEVITYCNNRGQLLDLLISGFKPITNRDILRILNMDMMDIDNYFKDRSRLFGVPTALLKYPARDYATNSALKEVVDITLSTTMNPVSYLKKRAIQLIIQQNATKFGEISKEEEDRKLKITNAVLPALPNLKKDFKLLPHQKVAIGRLGENAEALIDVSTGGGKTIILLCDILNLLKQGKIKKPLIIMPNNLVGQWASEIQKFTEGSINAFPINTEVWNDFDEDTLREMVKKAPTNTIFLTSYEFLRNDVLWEDVGVGEAKVTYNRSQFFLELGIDYVALDECHRIKNESSSTHNAVMAFTRVPYKRMASGSIIPNTPSDLPGQIKFIDPNLFGSVTDFNFTYGEYTNTTGKVIKWKDDAPTLIRNQLLDIGSVSFNRAAWLHTLPKLEEKIHYVDLKPSQLAIYKKVVLDTVEDILKDPKLREKWTKFSESDEYDSSDDFAPIIAKLGRIETFLNSPRNERFAREALDAEDIVSPKISKINELIDLHLSTDKTKVMVFAYHIESANGIYENIARKNEALLYHRNPKVLKEFIEGPKKIMVAAGASLKEGLNLQVVGRMIMCELFWSPGDFDQVLARMYRIDGGAIKREKIFLDIILGNKTIDTLKYARLAGKLLVNTKVSMGLKSKTNLSIPGVTVDNLESIPGSGITNYINAYNEVREYEKIKNEEIVKETGVDWIDVKRASNIPGTTIITPVVKAQYILPTNCLAEQLKSAEASTFIGKKVTTVLGPGIIRKIYKSTANVEVDGELVSISHANILLVDKKSKGTPNSKLKKEQEKVKVNLKERQPKEDTKQKVDFEVEINYEYLDGYDSLYVWREEADIRFLKPLGFSYEEPYWYIKIPSAQFGVKLIGQLKTKFDIYLAKGTMEQIMSMGKKKVPQLEPPSKTAKDRNQKSKLDNIRLYTLEEDGELFLCCSEGRDGDRAKKLRPFRFKREVGYWLWQARSKAQLKNIIKSISNIVTITNLKQLKKELKKYRGVEL